MTTDRTTHVSRLVRARRDAVYAALVDPDAVRQWRFPAGMTCTVHEFDARPGGAVHVTLTYLGDDGAGKSAEHSDTYRGRLVELVPGSLVVEVDEFETTDPAFAGPMTMRVELSDADGGTLVEATHSGIPAGVRLEDNAAGWEEALDRLSGLVAPTPRSP